MEKRRNPQGPAGPVGTIPGSYHTPGDIIAAHSAGKYGDTYFVGSELYIWDEEIAERKSAGNPQSWRYFTDVIGLEYKPVD